MVSGMELPSTLVQLFDGHNAAGIINFLTRVIGNSFQSHPCTQTRDEVKRRLDLCFELLKVMRGDMKWSFQRCCDEIPAALRRRLDGGIWEPSRRSLWMPGDGV